MATGTCTSPSPNSRGKEDRVIGTRFSPSSPSHPHLLGTSASCKQNLTKGSLGPKRLTGRGKVPQPRSGAWRQCLVLWVRPHQSLRRAAERRGPAQRQKGTGIEESSWECPEGTAAEENESGMEPENTWDPWAHVDVSLAGPSSRSHHHVPFFYVELVRPTGKRPDQFQIQHQFGENQRHPPGTWGWPEGEGARGWKRHCSHSSAHWWCCCRCQTRRRSPSTGRRPHGKLAEGRERTLMSPSPDSASGTALSAPDSTRTAKVRGHDVPDWSLGPESNSWLWLCHVRGEKPKPPLSERQ